jgi:hypothetical protein
MVSAVRPDSVGKEFITAPPTAHFSPGGQGAPQLGLEVKLAEAQIRRASLKSATRGSSAFRGLLEAFAELLEIVEQGVPRGLQGSCPLPPVRLHRVFAAMASSDFC